MRELLRSTKAYRAIASDAQSGRRSHAYLVLFPDETYLRALLRECAKAFFGAKDSSREAELIGEEMYSDCLYLPAAGAKLTVDDGARIVDESLLRPVEGDKKLFVLDNFHNASALVQNKLLKVLEEPPEGVHFLIGATAAFSVLPTVLSRVKKLEEPPFSEEAVLKALSEKYPGKDVRACAAASGGVFSAAELLLNVFVAEHDEHLVHCVYYVHTASNKQGKRPAKACSDVAAHYPAHERAVEFEFIPQLPALFGADKNYKQKRDAHHREEDIHPVLRKEIAYIDEQTKTLYWLGAGTLTIEVSSSDGNVGVLNENYC